MKFNINLVELAAPSCPGAPSLAGSGRIVGQEFAVDGHNPVASAPRKVTGSQLRSRNSLIMMRIISNRHTALRAV